MIEGFSYIADMRTHTLVIGSMPSVASLGAGKYYAHKHNLFWKLCFEAFGMPFDAPCFGAKAELLLSHGIGLWDAVKSCEREGSGDADIKAIVPNDFAALFSRYPGINRLLFNGQAAFKLFKRYNGEFLDKKEYSVLPSTSPANASIPLSERKRAWLEALRKTI